MINIAFYLFCINILSLETTISIICSGKNDEENENKKWIANRMDSLFLQFEKIEFLEYTFPILSCCLSL